MDELREWIRAAEAARVTCLNVAEFDVLIRHQKQRLEERVKMEKVDGREHAVKTDDPRLQENLKKLFERIQKINDLMLTVLKSHLILEQFINEFLDASGEKYDELTFAKKAKLCETLNPAEIDRFGRS
jgi:hypothetical protein